MTPDPLIKISVVPICASCSFSDFSADERIGICRHPKSDSENVDIVTGVTWRNGPMACEFMRWLQPIGRIEETCGPYGQFYKAKE